MMQWVDTLDYGDTLEMVRDLVHQPQVPVHATPRTRAHVFRGCGNCVVLPVKVAVKLSAREV